MPALVPVVDAIDKVPEPLRTFYEQKDGKFHLVLDGAPAGFVPSADLATANGKVVEFRDNNVKLLKEVEELRPLKTKFDGLDPEAARAALAKLTELEKKGIKGGDDVAAQIQAAVTAAVKPLQEQVAQTTKAAEDAQKRADESVFHSRISEKFLKAGGKAKAIDLVLGKAKDVFVVEGGEVKSRPNKFSTVHPGNPLDVDEWLLDVAKDYDFAFEPSSGGGAPGAKPGAAGGRADQVVLKDPTPAQLGEHAKAISQGKMRVEYSTP
ncbi:MAG TPA: hypothetical protein VMZ92_10620 [Planctomycetota bacterium]|nr:hypothetical protein [Planctomycetota bacterium]